MFHHGGGQKSKIGMEEVWGQKKVTKFVKIPPTPLINNGRSLILEYMYMQRT